MLNHRSQNDSDKEQRDKERRPREKELEAQRCHSDDSRKHRAHCELEKCAGRSGEELTWGKGLAADRGRKGSQDGGCPTEAADRLGREKSEDRPAPRKARTGNKVLLLFRGHLVPIPPAHSINCKPAGSQLLSQTKLFYLTKCLETQDHRL